MMLAGGAGEANLPKLAHPRCLFHTCWHRSPINSIHQEHFPFPVACSQASLLHSATQTFGPVQDSEIWLPMLYSPKAPMQTSASIEVPGTSYASISYYASWVPTTVNGKRA